MKYLSMLLIMVAMSVCMVSCGDDDDPASDSDYGSAVAGVYTGKLTVNNTVVEDAYVVTVTRVSSTVARVSADFYSDGGSNYNIKKEGGQYLFSSESSSNITISVTGKIIAINFLNGNGSITTFSGNRD